MHPAVAQDLVTKELVAVIVSKIFSVCLPPFNCCLTPNIYHYVSFKFLFCTWARFLTVLCFCRTHWQGLDHPSPHRSPMFILHVMSCTFSKVSYGVH